MQLKQRAVAIVIILSGVAGCNTNLTLTKEGCPQPDIVLDALNRNAGRSDNFPSEEVVSIEGLKPAEGSPKGDPAKEGTFGCECTLHLKSGKQQSGTVIAYTTNDPRYYTIVWQRALTPDEKREAEKEAEVRRKAAEIQIRCILIGNYYEAASAQRDVNRTPENALEVLQKFPHDNPNKLVTLEEKKAIINQVYFDPAFADAGGEALRNQMERMCIRESAPANNFQPLK